MGSTSRFGVRSGGSHVGFNEPIGEPLIVGNKYVVPDGKRHARVLIETPSRIECTHGSTTFWLHELERDDLGVPTKLSVTYERECDPNGPRAFGVMAFNADAPPPLIPRVAISVNKTYFGYGQKGTITARLSNGSTVRGLKIYAKPYGEKRRLIKSGNVNADGVMKVTYPMRANTTFQAVFDGGTTYPDYSRLTTVNVKSKVLTKMKKYLRKVGKYHIYKASHRIVIKARVKAARPGDCVAFSIQQHYRGRWRYLEGNGTRCIPLNSADKAKGVFRSSRANVGPRWRAVASVLHKGGRIYYGGPPRYFKVVR